MSIEDIVNVQISRDTRSVARQGFGVTLVLGVNKAFTSLSRTYSKQTDVLVDFNSTDKEAIASNTLFSQSPSPIQVIIGRRGTSDLTVVTVDTAIDNVAYTCTINGIVFSINSGNSATPTTIATALVAAINLGSEPVTATDNLDGTYDLVADVASAAYSVQTDINQSMVFISAGAIADDVANIQNENDTFYGSMYTLRDAADQEAMAIYIESQKKIFGTASNDANIIDLTKTADDGAAPSNSLASKLNLLGLVRSWVHYGGTADVQFPECALLGTILPLDPGSYTAAYQELSTITVDNLSPTQRTNALAKNAMVYTEVGGANITEEGKVAQGEFIDIIVFVDWIDSRITEGVFQLLVSSPKVSYDDDGINSIRAIIDQVLSDGIGLGGIAIDPAFTISVPLAINVSAGDKAARTLNNVTFQATLTGAIHIITITGTVSL